MRLKKLEMIGFKSFAQKTVLEFDLGITAVVGPNGCGKSNTADAFRWVLGEQSAKSMRGSKMPDVIFAGTGQRKALNFAEVTLTFTDVAGALPVDYEEVSVTRRLHRSGESEYFLNRQPVRLKDVQSLFLDSGVGSEAFSIFEQGKIDQVINDTPMERRSVFEEAAGILRFLQRKREALRKLEQTDQNVSRVKDIYQEVEQQITVLEKQAEQARLYKENKAQLEALDKGCLIGKWENLQGKYWENQEKEKNKKEVIEKRAHQLQEQQQQLQRYKSTLLAKEKNAQVSHEKLFDMRSNKEIATRDRQSYDERLKEFLNREKKLNQEQEELQEKQKKGQSDFQEREAERQLLEKKLREMEKTLHLQQGDLQSLEMEAAALRQQQLKAQQERVKQIQAAGQVESEVKQNKVRLEGTQERLAQLQKQEVTIAHAIEELLQQIEEKKEQVLKVSSEVSHQKQSLEEIDTQLQDWTSKTQTIQLELDGIIKGITESEARQKVLTHLRNEMEGFSQGSKRLLQETENPKSPLYNKILGIYELVSAEKGFEAPLAASLRFYAHTLVVNHRSDFHEVLSFAQKQQIKDFSLICLEHLPKEGRKVQPEQLAAHVVNHPLSLHLLHHVHVAENAEAALELMQKQKGISVVTQEGVFIDREHILFYLSQTESNTFSREAELKALAQIAKEKTEHKQVLVNQLEEVRKTKEALQKKRIDLDRALRAEEIKLVETQMTLQRLQADQEKKKREKNELSTEQKLVQENIAKVQEGLKNLAQKHAMAEKIAAEALQVSLTADTDLEQRTATLKMRQKELREQESAYHKLLEENQKLIYALNLLEAQEQEGQKQERKLIQEMMSCQEGQQKIKTQDKVCDQDLQELDKALEGLSTTYQQLEQEVLQEKKTIEQLENQIGQLQVEMKQCEGEQYQVGIKLAQQLSSLQAIEAEMQERYCLAIDEAKAKIPPLTIKQEEAERKARALRQEIEVMGNVNMTSIEEFDKQKERYEFLKQQLADLNRSREELVQIIAQLDDQSRKIFKETFDIICQNFKKNFQILFNGGEADLLFTEGDLLEAGIEIIAKPPGKQMRSITLLSGGEKCLTAMALLFAIFEVKASPFCILDEIDAPLDDSNVERFLRVVKAFTDRCQFIIITHNKRTMAIADRLYGVSMEEKGVSKLLSLDFSHQSSKEPALAMHEE